MVAESGVDAAPVGGVVVELFGLAVGDLADGVSSSLGVVVAVAEPVAEVSAPLLVAEGAAGVVVEVSGMGMVDGALVVPDMSPPIEPPGSEPLVWPEPMEPPGAAAVAITGAKSSDAAATPIRIVFVVMINLPIRCYSA
jgi:hypothetical protein